MNSITSLSLVIGLMAAHHHNHLMCQVKVPSRGDCDLNIMFHLPHIIPRVDAFPINSYITNTRGLRQATGSLLMSTSSSVAADASVDENSDNVSQTTSDIVTTNDNVSLCYTTAILKVSYDGTHFSGWTGGNAGDQNKVKPKQQDINKNNNNNNNKSTQSSQKRRQSRRSRTLQRKGGGWYDSNNKVRTVEHTIRMALAKIYGNVDPKSIIFEACSRTDAGVHATSLVTQFYCYNGQVPIKSTNSTTYYDSSTNSTIPIRPNGPTDSTNFVQLPFNSDLSKLVYVLNRMLPPDVRVLAASPMPTVISNSIGAFHPTLSTQSKTYVYRFAIGNIQDPLQSRFVWHLDGSSGRAMGMNGNKFDLELAIQAAKLFVSADAKDYAAFGSVMRGNEKNRVRSTICTIRRCDLLQENGEQLPSWEQHQSSNTINDAVTERYGSRLNVAGAPLHPMGIDKGPQTFTVSITGDRFMYKMVRNIVGTIVAVACGHNDLEDIQQALSTKRWGNGPSGSRRICAPARGLKLVEVNYPDDVHFDWQSG